MWSTAVLGVGLWLATTTVQGPVDIRRNPEGLFVAMGVLLLLTLLSSVSPMETRSGSTVTVGLAPLFGAFIVLPSWALMTVAALGTIDERVPGHRIPWSRFFFNRGMFALMYGLPSLAFHALGIREKTGLWYLCLAMSVVAIVALNVGQMAVSLSLVQGFNVVTTARRMVSGNWSTYIALPLIGYLISVLLQQRGLAERLSVFLLYSPLLIYRATLRQQNRLDRWLRDSFIMQSRIVDKRDGQTHGHSQRVGELCEAVGRLLRLSDEQCRTIRTGGILHDLGKIAIPDGILLKPAKLTPEEYEIIKTHPVEGAQILAEHPEQKEVATIVMHHHEKWDGTGYPDGLKGEQIPIGSRIVNACDAFDTMTVARVFRLTVKTPTEAMLEMRQLGGTWYDPAVVAALEKVVAERWGVRLPPQVAPEPEKRPRFAEALAIRPFRLLWVGQAISYFGDMMNTTGLAVMLYLVTREPSLVALGLIAKAAPTILFGLIAGPLVDRFNRQRLMIAADLLRAILTLTIPFLALNWLPGVFITVFLIATASAFSNPAKQAILPNLVPGNLLVRANGLIASSEKTMELLGYSLAGLIAAVLSWLPLFLIDTATYIISALTLLGVYDDRHAQRPKELHLRDDIIEGMQFIRRNATLRSTMGLTFMAVLFSGMTFPILVVMAYGPLRGDAFGYGLLEAGIGAGAVLGALAAARMMSRYQAGVMILIGVGGMGLANAVTGFSQNLWLALVVLFMGGILNTIYYVPLISVTQREAPDRIRGRVMSTRFLLVQLGLLCGMALAGPLTDHVGAPVVYAASGFLLICAAAVGLAFHSLRGAKLREEPVQPALTPAT